MTDFYNSAGLGTRTRRPLALKNNLTVASKEAASTVTAVSASVLNDAITDTTLAENGYATGNARYLHLQIQGVDADSTLTLYSYNYAFGAWATLYIPVGIKNGADTTAELAYVAATFNSLNGKKQLTIPIHGVDRIGFAHGGNNGNSITVRAAVSTF